jgi:transposase-like protein
MPPGGGIQTIRASPEVIRLAVIRYMRFPLSLRNDEDRLHERGIEISHETVRLRWNRFRPMSAAQVRCSQEKADLSELALAPQ